VFERAKAGYASASGEFFLQFIAEVGVRGDNGSFQHRFMWTGVRRIARTVKLH